MGRLHYSKNTRALWSYSVSHFLRIGKLRMNLIIESRPHYFSNRLEVCGRIPGSDTYLFGVSLHRYGLDVTYW